MATLTVGVKPIIGAHPAQFWILCHKLEAQVPEIHCNQLISSDQARLPFMFTRASTFRSCLVSAFRAVEVLESYEGHSRTKNS